MSICVLEWQVTLRRTELSAKPLDSVPEKALASIEQRIVKTAVAVEQIPLHVIAYDTTNFFTHLETGNTASQLGQRGHSKQRRHDLRQLGLTLMVSEEGQIPLDHTLYEGSRADVKSFAAQLEPLRRRLAALNRQLGQLTLVFDQGAESESNLQQARDLQLAYVTALKPSHHRDWLEEDSGQLETVRLSHGDAVRARRTLREVHGVEHTVVTLFSPALYEGQRRGLDQNLRSARRQVARILHRQYLRQVLHCELQERDQKVEIRSSIDAAALQHLEQNYFGLRLLATTRQEWSTAQIIQAYRGQARVERAFRDLKDPWVCAFRPQYHWTDQKLMVHAMIAVLSLLLDRILMRRAQRQGYRGSLRSLIQQLGRIRIATLAQLQPRSGRTLVYQQIEEADPGLLRLAQVLNALPQ